MTYWNEKLIEAVIYDRLNEISEALDNGADMNLRMKDMLTPLMRAAYSNKPEIAKLLIDKGANLSLQDHFGNTALMNATISNRAEIANLLIDKGANLDLQNGIGNTALITAASWGSDNIARALIDKGANLHLRNNDGKTALDLAHKSDRPGIVAIIEEALAKEKNRDAVPETSKPKTPLERIEEQRRNSTFMPPWGLVGR